MITGLFDSVVFLFTFLPVVLFLYYLMPGGLKNGLLLLASLLFYAWGEPAGVFLMAGMILFNYAWGIHMAGILKNRRRARSGLIICVIVNLGILGFFLYGRTVIGAWNTVFPVQIPFQGYALPMGMSFYTLQMLSYVIDVYRGEGKVQKNPADLALYVSMFPKMPGGPVVRYSEMEKQLKARQMSLGKIGEGAMFFIRGLFKKVIFADNMGLLHAEVMGMEAGQVSVLCAWLGCGAFALMIYYNLSGYTDMAIGLGKMTGFEFPGNFDYPFLAGSTTEFWYKWHMSLGAWFREYVYHPLGGGDVEESKQIRNILLIWLLTGLFHGLSAGYVIWGLYCGLLMVAEKLFLWRMLDRLPGILGHIYSIIMVMIGWVFFFHSEPSQAFAYLGRMFGAGAYALADDRGMYLLVTNLALLIVMAAGLHPFVHKAYESVMDRGGRGKALVNGMIYGVMFILCVAYIVT